MFHQKTFPEGVTSVSSMLKTLILHKLLDENDRPALERWFVRDHCREVLMQMPWLKRYVLYRGVPAPRGAEAFGLYNYRLHENWVGAEGRRGINGTLSMTPEPGEKGMEATVVTMPAEPTDDFHGAELRYNEKTILRWLTVFSYPEGVSLEEGEDWYLNVHVPEVMKQPGLIRFFSTKAIIRPAGLPGHSSKQRPFIHHPSPLMGHQWHRVSELWYENNNGWVDSILQNPPAYTKPSWATQDSYPFVKPDQDFVSTFILERPDQDMLRDYERAYI